MKIEVTTKFPEWFVEMIQEVLDMRDAQKDLFEGRTAHKQKVAMAREHKVDDLLKPFIEHGIVYHKEKPKSNQSELFKG